MASIGDIRHHMNVVGQTRKITKAMHMISTSKMQKGLSRFDANSRFFQRLRQTMKDLLTHNEVTHSYFMRPAGERRAYVVIASDKGLAGGYNHEVLSLATQHMQGHENYIFTVGQMARSWFEQQGMLVDIEFSEVMHNPTLDSARQIAETVLELYDQDMLDEVYIAYTRPVSPLEQKPYVMRLLPVRLEDFDEVEIPDRGEYEIRYEPSAEIVLRLLIPQYIIGIIYGTLLLSFASEQSARMNAMDAATRNADELIGKLAVDLNRARQGAITNELSEIITGASAIDAG